MAKILVIDDDPDIVTAVRMTLESVDHEVFEAGSGKEGLAMIEKVQPDLIVLDVMMETHTEGFQLALKLRSPDPTSKLGKFKDIPILMLTAQHRCALRQTLITCRSNCLWISPSIPMT